LTQYGLSSRERPLSPSKLYVEPKLKDFLFKLMHRNVVTKRELFRYGIRSDDDCVYCGKMDSIDHTLQKHFHMR